MIRNFWLWADVDGKKAPFQGGPRNKDGGMVVSITQRDEGHVEKLLDIVCSAEEDGKLVTKVIADGATIYEYKSER